ncbi:ROK family protein [Phycisphaerales bacterium AB-hyl4]|uniref:ROK family protein n=1 Tax=Natronomicrosphaera hydrolytica TaxID=3242702 RepID=A0ABV4U7H0_9BACT
MSGHSLIDNAIFGVLVTSGDLSIPAVARSLEMPTSTANGIVQRLVEEGRIERESVVSAGATRRGRPAARYRPRLLKPVAACALDGSSLSVGLVDRDLSLVGRHDRRFRAREMGQVLELIVESFDEACAEAGMKRKQFAGLALSANVLTMAQGVVSSSVLPWIGVEAIQHCRSALGMEVRLLQHAHLIAAYQGIEPPRPRMMVRFNVGDGVSAHQLTGGRPHAGASGMAGELGHTIVDPDGPLCGCGRRGCLEALASGPAICRALIERATPAVMTRLDRAWLAATPPSQAFDAVYEAWLAGDGAVVSVMEKVLDDLARTLATALNMLDPDQVLASGYVLQNHPQWLDQLEQRMRRWVFQLDRRNLRLVPEHTDVEQVLRVAALLFSYPACFDAFTGRCP